MTETQADRAVQRIRLEMMALRFSITMLAVTTVWIGIAMILGGAPSFIEGWFSPWSRYLVGGWAFVSGLLTSAGALIGDDRRRGWWAQVVGLAGMTSWYIGMSVAYVCLAFTEGVHILGWGEPLMAGQSGRGYVGLVYLGLAFVTGGPLVTLLRIARPGAMGPDETSGRVQ
jgi:hypothetical protein